MLKTEKEQRWEEMVEQFSRTVDKIGYPIDESIFETVVALNAMGIYTMSSCEGHLDHGQAHPWVHIGSPAAEPVEKQASEKLREAQRSPDHYRDLMAEADQITARCKWLHQAYSPNLMQLLERFYQKHPLVYDRHLVLDNRLWTGRILLQSQGADYQEFAENRAQKLREYQQEMQAFGNFLKQLYFASEGKSA